MALFELEEEKGRLTGHGPMDDLDEPTLRNHCIKLVMSDAPLIDLDFSEITGMSSRCLGTLVTLWVDLCGTGRKLKITPSESVQKTLDLCGTKITDDGLQHLMGLQELKKVNLLKTGVTDEGLKKLQKVFPECLIER